jgi:phosphopantothenoylcysteine decarboxylase/phosphopantothenate--cysteine ligase
LGVTGSIAAYKAVEVASRLAQVGVQVEVILTEAACQFVTPLTFQSVTGRRAYRDADLWGVDGHVQHIALGHTAELLVIAPASAHTLAKLAQGQADNLLTLTALAAQCPLVLAPAMDGGMFAHPATQANLATLRARGAQIIGPAEGHLASGLTGVGRMVEPAAILGWLRWQLGRGGPLAGRRVVVTAGGTEEPLDPVRALTNRSSGKQGYALAQAALDAGADVTLISGPTALIPPTGATLVAVRTALEMAAAVQAAVGAEAETDALVMAAAVADFRPREAASHKIKKEAGLPQLTLTANPDILQGVAETRARTGWPRVTIGFAAESDELLANAARKLAAKRLDLIVANDIGAPDAGFAVDTNRVTLLDAAGGREVLPLLSKAAVAEAVIARLVGLLAERQA